MIPKLFQMLVHKLIGGLCRLFSVMYNEGVRQVKFSWTRDADGRQSLNKMFFTPGKDEAQEMQERILRRINKSGTIGTGKPNEKKSDRDADGL